MEKVNFLIPVYRKVRPLFVKGKGSFLWDDKGRKYLDFFPGWGVSILGHCYSRLVKVICQQSQLLIHLPNNLYHPWQGLLAEEIVNNSFKGKVFFANSGAEAVESAIKFSRLYGEGKRYEIITMKNSFHGRTFGAMSATGQSKYKLPFKPLLPKFREVKFNDFKDFKLKVNKRTVGVILELIQGEGGVNVADKEYIKNLWGFCRERNLLFILDEVQTGLGRTGKMFCFQHYGIKPDIMLLSKGLGGGLPISCMVVRDSIADIMKQGDHASTFGGAPLVCRASLEVFKIIKEENLLNNVRVMSSYIFTRIRKMQRMVTFIREVRGRGLMLGIELKIDSYPIFEKALERGLIVNSTHRNVLRIMPAINISKQELEEGLDILESVFRDFKI
ncbi:MAG: aspartate aminotransferase family protein [Candidatus Omnitrophica bacterium]|nr:aspartate aminotransferase family protein [Candidatus Omnitrophota bacterium]MCM8825994.1 aspartate aminotransferase family protein [Candidatus Omnitrophota bacterium]